jgi:hypothetical protein
MAFGFGGQRPPIMPQRPGVGRFGAAPTPGAGGVGFGGPYQPEPFIRSMKKGGKVKKTGKYKLHKGERVVPAKKSRKRGDTSAFVGGKEA